MKAMILAGGRGTRIMEESQTRPKPMIEIGDMPILWHIMKIYAAHGVREFIICLGYKGHMIKDFFAHYRLFRSNVTIDLRENARQYHQTEVEDWSVTLVETGDATQTGGRIRRAAPFLGEEKEFFLTYGDGVGDVNLEALVKLHHEKKALVTVTSVTPPGRFGSLEISGDMVQSFREKPAGDGATINGGFFVVSRKAVDYIENDATVWEREPLERLSARSLLAAYQHPGFWHPLDTMRDKLYLDQLWESGNPPWRVW